MNRSKKLGTALILVLSLLLLTCQAFARDPDQTANQAQPEPQIEFNQIPYSTKGGAEILRPISGRVIGASAGQRIVLFTRSDNWWYVQPLIRSPFTDIGPDSSWSNSTHLGVEYAALLVDPGYVPPTRRTQELPPLGGGVVAIAVTDGTPPFWSQLWFQSSVAIAAFITLFWLFRIRVRQLERRAKILFDERLAERTRVARELHDTFLQTVQGSKMVADHALKDRADHARMVRAMQQLSGWLGRATEEGRAALNSLRSSTTEMNDLAEAFRRAIEECRPQTGAEISFFVNGTSREMHPVVRDEIYCVGHEAIRNACAHANGDHIDITLECSRDFTFSVRDDGVGIDPSVAQKGKEGHFGLQGMKERAERLGGKLTVVSSPGSGTVVTLVVPGRIVFSFSPPSLSERIRSFFEI